jgi:ketosteroid isomerase-like protein
VGLSRLAGVGLGDAPFDISGWDVAIVKGGRFCIIERFPLDRLADALRRFDELAPSATLDYLNNDEARRHRHLWESALAGEWQHLAATTAEDAVIDDRRAMAQFRAEGRDAVLDYLRSVLDVGVTHIEMVSLATRGERLGLTRAMFRGRRGEAQCLAVSEFAPDGHYLGTCVFEPDDLDAAFAELDARYAAGEGAPFAETVNAARALLAAINGSDWEALELLLADDYSHVDHRMTGVGTLDRDEYVASLGALVELAPDARWRVVAVPRLGAEGLVYVLHVTGTDVNNGAFEILGSGVGTFRAGQLARLEFFPSVERALVRFDELSAPPAPTFPIPNRAAVAVRRSLDALAAQDRHAWVVCFSSDAVFDDRRPVVGGVVMSGTAWMERDFGSLAAVSETESKLIATRGENLVLHHGIFRGYAGAGGPFEADFMQVAETQGDGLICRRITFDPNDLDVAFAELDARFLAGEGASFAEEIAVATALLSAYNDRDWRKFESLCTEDCDVLDHRPAGWGALDREGLVETLREFLDLVPMWRAKIIAVPQLTRGGAIGAFHSRGTDAAGGEIELVLLLLATYRDGRVSRLEFFGVADLREALARLDELISPLATDGLPPPNAAAVALRRGYDALTRKDRDAYLACFTPDIIREDRRAIVGGVLSGASEMERSFESTRAVTTIESKLVATRGETLALCHSFYRGNAGAGGPFEVDVLDLIETDLRGLMCRRVVFAPHDIDAALAELDARFEATSESDAPTIALRWQQAFNAADWQEFEALTADDFVFVDYPRLWGPGNLDRGGFLRWTVGVADVTSDFRFRVLAVPRAANVGAVVLGNLCGLTADGGPFEQLGWSVIDVADGRVRRWELFGEDGLGQAMTRFDDLANLEPVKIPASIEAVPDNPAVTCWRRHLNASVAGDWDAVAPCIGRDPRVEDRRAGLRTAYSGRAEMLADAQRVFRFMDRAEAITVATRGERLALVSQCWTGLRNGGEFEVPLLSLVETGADDRIVCYINFDPDDLAGAVAELDERYAALLPAGEAAAVTFGREVIDLYNRRDWNDLRRLVTDDFVVVDERVTGWGTVDREQFVRLYQQLQEMAPDAFMLSVVVHRVAVYGSAQRIRITGTVPEGGPFELLFEAVTILRGGRLARFDLLVLGQVDEALRRLDQLGPSQPLDSAGVADNAAAAAWRRTHDAALARDWDLLSASIALDAQFDDRRAGLTVSYAGHDPMFADLKRIFLAVNEVKATTIATRGEHLALLLWWHAGSRWEAVFETTFLLLCGIDDKDRLSSIVNFDPDDLASGIAELDTRYVAELPEAEASSAAIAGALIDCYNNRDWDSFRQMLTHDFMLVDERMTGWGTVDADQAVQLFQQLLDAASDAFLMCLAYHRVAPKGTAGRVCVRGTDAHGGSFELVFEQLMIQQSGKVARLELLPLGQVDEALCRLDAFTPPAASEIAVPDNTASAAARRYTDAVFADEWDVAAATVSPSIEMDDRRVGLAVRYVGREQMLADSKRVQASVNNATAMTVATRGDHIALVAWHYIGGRWGAEFEIDFLLVVETDPDDMIVSWINFDPDDRARALTELDDRYAASLPAEQTATFAVLRRFVDLYNRQDWEGLRGVLTDDFVRVDERVIGWGAVDRDQWLRRSQQLVEMAPDAFMLTTVIQRVDRHGGLGFLRISGTVPDGGPFDLSAWGITAVRNGKLARLESCPTAELAIDHFDRLLADEERN